MTIDEFTSYMGVYALYYCYIGASAFIASFLQASYFFFLI